MDNNKLIKNKSAKLKLKSSLIKNQNLIINQLKQEWKEAEEALINQKKKEQLIELAKNIGINAGEILLGLLLAGGVLTVAAMTPNIFSAYGRFAKRQQYFKKEQFNRDRYYLKRHNLIKIKKINEETFELYLTEKGKDKSIGEAFKNLKIQKPQKDDYWRVVMFDIPNKHKWARDAFRQKLRIMGFYQLQESVFILPYPCEKEVILIAEILNIVDFVHLIKTKDFSNNKELKDFYN